MPGPAHRRHAMSARHLHTTIRNATPRASRPPLLFVHGGYVNGDCWDCHFLDYFSARGYDCVALDLSGHGRSDGRDELNELGIDDYVADVARVAATLATPPVLIGHSMGGVVVQRYLERNPGAGVALLAPVPTTGLSFSSVQLVARQPDFLREASRALRRKYSADTIRVMRDVYFSPDATEEDLAPFLPMVQPESDLAISEMMAMVWNLPKRRPRIPALAIAGSKDAVFSSSLLHFSASSWNAKTVIVPRAGHMLMMDPQWQATAEPMHAWLETVPPATH